MYLGDSKRRPFAERTERLKERLAYLESADKPLHDGTSDPGREGRAIEISDIRLELERRKEL